VRLWRCRLKRHLNATPRPCPRRRSGPASGDSSGSS
jgi:hypothetical protein